MILELSLKELKEELQRLSNKKIAQNSQRYFKTGPGEYGEGDQFLGLRVPQLHALSKRAQNLNLTELQYLLNSPWHEERLIALMILVLQMKKCLKKEGAQAKEIQNFYLKNTSRINNWDLVDASARDIVGVYLLKFKEDREVLYRLAKSDYIWERRIAVISTFAFIREGVFDETLKLCELLMKDPHDLMQKAQGWMLREVGKKDTAVLETFLDRFATQMPRTMLRYSIERFPAEKRLYYLKKE